MSQLLEAQLLALLGVTNSGKPNPKHNRRGWEQKVHPGIWYYQNIPKRFNHLEGEWNGMEWNGIEWIDPEKRERFEKSKRYKKQKSEFRQFDAKAPIQRSNIFFIIMLAELFGCWYADLEKLTFSRGYLECIMKSNVTDIGSQILQCSKRHIWPTLLLSSFLFQIFQLCHASSVNLLCLI